MKGSPDRGGGPWVRTSPPAQSSPEQQQDARSSNIISQTERASLEALLRYETMVRAQDAEYQATSLHLRPLFDAIKELARREENSKKGGRKGGGGGIFGFGRSFPSKKRASVVSEECLEFEDIKSVYRLLSSTDEAAKGSRDVSQQLLRSDRQLIYILELLSDVNSDSGAGKSEIAATITFAEFVQCYEMAVGGMQCIQQTIGEDAFEIRRRVVDRTTSNIRSFGPGGDESNGSLQQQSAKSLRRLSSSSQQGLTTNAGTLSSRIFGGDDATGELEEEIDYLRKLLAVKDKQLVRILTDHRHNVESISYETDKKAEEIGLYIRRRRRRRRQLRKALMIVTMLLLVFCYHIGVIRIVESNLLPRVSIHLNELVEYIGLGERDELESLKQDALRQKYRISALEAQENQLRTELKVTKVKLDSTTQDHKRAKEDLRINSSAALDSCKAEVRKVREEAASLRLEGQEGCEIEQGLLQVDSVWFKNLLLGPFQNLLAKTKLDN
mmetsp:Transcript_4791/g.10175  ORF Transcript_4791/g.10175 Transcript_4791/m.10175 type:complete len:498 (+) Transcript_4791:172-1665(+)